MRKRVRKLPRVEAIPLPAARMVTLGHPEASIAEAAGAFVRLDPPPNLSPEEIAAWRARVADVAVAVRVLPARADEAVPAEDMRPAADRGTDVLRVALEIAAERGGAELVAEVERIFG